MRFAHDAAEGVLMRIPGQCCERVENASSGRFAGCRDQVKIVIAQSRSQYGIISPKGVETPMEEMTMTQDRSLEAFKRLVPHLRGSL